MRILHISDIQEGRFGVKTDLKKSYPKTWQEEYDNILDDLKTKFRSIHSQQPIDIIIISGDLASMQ